jgi:multicomponent Na+:H+ antiporter subunit G
VTAGIADMVGAVLIAIGAFFFVVGAIGIYRLPDVFTRMHAAGISDTVGAGLLVAGMMFTAGFSLVTVKLLIILCIIYITSPIATHALAQAALHAGLEPLLADKRVLTGPGVHAEPARASREVSKTKSRAAKAKPPVKRAADKARRAQRRKRRTRS